MKTSIDFTRVNSDVNGNPRYACHFLDCLHPEDDGRDISPKYAATVKRMNKLGGKKYHNKSFGGGIVFQSYNIQDLEELILLSTGEMITAHREPTQYELLKGYGATHYRNFYKADLLNRKGELKKWFKANDGLNYSLR